MATKKELEQEQIKNAKRIKDLKRNSRIAPAPKDKTAESRRYFARIGIHFD